MPGLVRRSLAAGVVVASAALFTSVGVHLSTAQESKAPDLSDLRDAVKAAAKRGANVADVAKSLDALEKALAQGWTAPTAGRTVPPPPELKALREAVEAAARKGENVDAIRKELEPVEKAVAGQVLVAPKPVPPAEPPVPPRPEFPRPVPQPFPLPLQVPDFRPGGRINPADLQKAQDLMRKALELRLKNPDDAEALKLLDQAREMMLQALAGGGLNLPDLGLPEFALPNPGLGRPGNRVRLGVSMEKITPLVVEQLALGRNVGVAITAVVPGSPAEKVGLKVHDVIVEINGKPVTDAPEDFTRRVNEFQPGEKIDLVVVRQGKRVEVKAIELADVARPAPRVPDFNPLPALPDRKPVPLPAFPNGLPNVAPRLPMNDGLDLGLGLLDPKLLAPQLAPRKGDSTIVSGNNENVAIYAVRDGVNFAVYCKKAGDGALTAGKISIADGDAKSEMDGLDKVPEKYRGTVEKLLRDAR